MSCTPNVVETKVVYVQSGARGQQGEAGPSLGWAAYKDSQYTEVSPFSLSPDVWNTIPNNSGVVLENGSNVWYENGFISPDNVGDYYILTVRFKTATHVQNAFIEFGVDIGGALGIQFRNTEVLVRPQGTTSVLNFVVPFYSLDTFVANGGIVKLRPNEPTTIYDIEYQIAKIHASVA